MKISPAFALAPALFLSLACLVTTTVPRQEASPSPFTVLPTPADPSPLPLSTVTGTSRPTPRPTSPPRATQTLPLTSDLIRPQDLDYLGAFRLPDGGAPPLTFEYGGNAMTFDPDHGTLFISGHDRLAYGQLPNGSQIAELRIPEPVNSRRLEELPYAEFVQPFRDVLQGYFAGIDEIPRLGMAYLDHPLTGPQIHLGWGMYLPADPPVATHLWFSPDLSAPQVQGPWFIGDQPHDRVNGYLFALPEAWSEAYTGGRRLASGRFKDGGWGGMGPALFAYQPWDARGNPLPAGSHLPEVTLLQYESSLNTDNIERCLQGYQHPDEWEGSVWVTAASGKQAVVFSGTKSNGGKYWYGYANPAGVQYPCIDSDLIGDFPLCRLADGSPCPPEDLVECPGHTVYRGWWTSHWDAQLMFYDPADLASVAQGRLSPWEPQPYATLDVDERLYFQPAVWDQDMLGVGDQRRYRLGDVAYDAAQGRLYVLELYGEGAKPVVHVWQVNP